MNNQVILLFVAIGIVLCSACGLTDEEVRAMARIDYERQESELRNEQIKICENNALIQAEQMADSIIREMKINPLKDSLYQPKAPPKPAYVETDSTILNSKRSVKPILVPIPNPK